MGAESAGILGACERVGGLDTLVVSGRKAVTISTYRVFNVARVMPSQQSLLHAFFRG